MTDASAYDEVEYPPYLHPQMHPARLAAIARLHGIPAASPKQCRLMEVGCGDGLQLLTLAQAYPDSQFVGVDMSQRAIARGEALRRKLGLDNLSLVVADLLTWDPSALPYDYVIAHGFYSWVPEPVRECLLTVCDAHLADAGIAYVSYNTLPGCHLRRMVWEMLDFHVDHDAEPGQQLASAAHFLEWLDHALLQPKKGMSEGYLAAIRHEIGHLKDASPALIFHDDMSPFNTPLLFSAFMAQAATHHLDYLAEADYFEMSDMFLPAEARAHLDQFTTGDRIAREQYLDFLKGRRFRQTILCRSGWPQDIATSAVLGMEASARLRAEIPSDSRGTRFSIDQGAALIVSHPLTESVFSGLPSTGRPARLSDLRDQAAASPTIPASPEDDSALAEALAFAFRIGLLSLTCEAPHYSDVVGATPRISALARAQLEAGSVLFASLRTSIVRIDDPLARELMRLLDGTRDHAMLLRDLTIWRDANPDSVTDHEVTTEALDASLAGLATMALLEL